MNPHAAHPVSFTSLVSSLLKNRQLILQMAWREVLGRYKGSMIGVFWSFINPLLMLAVYTFIFSVVFKAKWGIDADENKASFAVVLFVGLIVHGLLAEVLNRAPSLIVSNVNYVKKVVYPLEILVVINLVAALFHSAVSILVLLIVFIGLNGYIHWTSIFLPIVLLPLATLVLGVGWILASLGVFLRDIGQTIGILTTAMLFMAPVFFPLSAVPVHYHAYILANPLTFIIEQSREIVVYGHQPDWLGLGVYMVVALIVAWSGYGWFQKTRKGFADVL